MLARFLFMFFFFLSSFFLLFLILIIIIHSAKSHPIRKQHSSFGGSTGGSAGKGSACNVGDLGLISELGRFLEKGMVTHPSILAWRISWTV